MNQMHLLFLSLGLENQTTSVASNPVCATPTKKASWRDRGGMHIADYFNGLNSKAVKIIAPYKCDDGPTAES